MILSPQIRQYLKILQMPLFELAQEIDLEMSQNPLLEERGDESDSNSDAENSPEVESGVTAEINPGEDYNKLEQLESNLGDHYSYESGSSGANAEDLQKLKDYQEASLTTEESLLDHLMNQIRLLDFSDEDLVIITEILGNLNEHGYLQAELSDIATACKTTTENVERLLKEIQKLDPPGIAARDLKETLLLQLERLPETELAREIVSGHLDLLEKRNISQIAKNLGLELDKVRREIEKITRLEPRPGRRFYQSEPISVVPDAVVRETDQKENRFKVEIRSERLPSLRINPYYKNMLNRNDLDETTRIFIKEKLQKAMDFLKAISQRKSTIREITEAIIREQPEFFDKGFSHLKPMRLKDIADTLGIHESTVSRAISGKYIQTPQGTIPFRSFFSSKLETSSGEAESQKSIMAKIKQMVDAEKPEKPLSDQALVKKLNDEGIMIARRTVAKYRELLKILPSYMRKQK